ncbi:sigma-70 family RNA polymerase sigma factor [Rhodocytophaga aerolata]|uniref:Sigma-70 family RNA polymerase sigma factor n=1 Tax=Rhodocytophaga aerolata TaxID=455078 RepID=A0ABT8RDZ7_9BACT|nr:sigma-70 family RNA polymerase sigma factor [Rhodocytophaga aerolata]MDO1450270.1 sigma-70 family RNA polymerase sigma factor [Rhodocytophaga aerolata]
MFVDKLKERKQPVDSKTEFEEVYHTYHQKVYSYFIKHTGSTFLSEELVQLTFIKLWKNFARSMAAEISVSSQIFCIARSTLIDELRKQARERDMLQTIRQEEKASYTQNAVFENYQYKEIYDAINTLPPVRKKVFQLRKFYGYSYEDIARNLSISKKTVEDHITKATKQLKKILNYKLSIFFLLSFFIK